MDELAQARIRLRGVVNRIGTGSQPSGEFRSFESLAVDLLRDIRDLMVASAALAVADEDTMVPEDRA